MSSRIIVRNRVVWESGRPNSRAVRRMPMYKPETEDGVHALPPFVPDDLPPRLGAPYFDEDDQVTYRVVSTINPLDGWCLMGQLTSFYGVPYRVVLQWCQMGHMDALMEYGSPTKRYRPRDNMKCRELAEEWKAKKALRARGKKGSRSK